MTNEQRQALLDSTAAKLSEHFGAVQICASLVTPEGGTNAYMSGNGDWFARRGLCEEFVDRDQALTQARMNKDVNRAD